MADPASPPRTASTDRKAQHRRWRILRLPAVLTIVVFLFWITGCMEHMFYHPDAGPTPVPRRFPGGESVSFTSADGTRLHGWFLPATGGALNAPTILQVHGNAGNVEGHIGFTEYLPAAGFNLFIFDYRGYGQSDGSARKRGPLIDDTDAALDVLLARPDVDPDRIGMYGQSLGGSIGLNVMAERPEIRCAVIESAFTSWRDIAANVLGGGAVSRSLAALLIDDSHRADEAIATVQRPILLLHGTADSIIPVAHSRQLKEAGGRFATLIELPGGDHNSLRDTHPQIEASVIDFFRANLVENAVGSTQERN